MKTQIRSLVRNGIDKLSIRTEQLDGRDHLVVPVVAVVEGVLNGQLATIGEFEKTLQLWEGKPTPLSHPTKNGENKSANGVQERDVFNVGWFFNVHIEGDKMKGEIWIDIEKAEGMEDGQTLLNRLNSIDTGPIEVSTAYWSTTIDESGSYDGDSYTGIQTNIIPDHLAILLDEVGACSIVDGCGLGVNQLDDKDRKNREIRITVTNVSDGMVSVNDLRQILSTAVNAVVTTTVYVIDIMLNGLDGDVIYELWDMSSDTWLMYRRSFSFGSDYSEVSLGDDSEEVRALTVYEPSVVTNHTLEGENVDREQLIVKLISNESVPFSEEALRAMDDSGLNYLANGLDIDPLETPAAPALESIVAPVAPETDTILEVVKVEATPTDTNILELAPNLVKVLNELGHDGLAGVIANAKVAEQTLEDERLSLISRLKAHEGVRMSNAILDGLDINTARELAQQFIPVTRAGMRGASTVSLNTNEDNAAPQPPAIVLAKSD